LAANGSTPSVLGPRRELGGVVIKKEGEGPGVGWSSVFPLPCEEGWSKPHLLVEVCVRGWGGKIGRTITPNWGQGNGWGSHTYLGSGRDGWGNHTYLGSWMGGVTTPTWVQ
jgi:hypothetical protein